MDRGWMKAERTSETYMMGLVHFMDFLRKNARQYGPGRYKCPCARCCGICVRDTHTIWDHLRRKGIIRSYKMLDYNDEAREARESSNRDISAQTTAQNMPSSSENVNHAHQFVVDVDPSLDTREVGKSSNRDIGAQTDTQNMPSTSDNVHLIDQFVANVNPPQDARVETNDEEDLNRGTSSSDVMVHPAVAYKLSIVSPLVEVKCLVRNAHLTASEMFWAHWTIIEYCDEAKAFVEAHLTQFQQKRPNGTHQDRVMSFNYNFRQCIMKYPSIQRELVLLSLGPRSAAFYSQCTVNGVKFVCLRLDHKRRNQNSGVMIEANNIRYYGVILDICVLTYAEDMSVVLFKCRWYNERKLMEDHGFTSVNTASDCFTENPYCLAIKAKKVFYVDDPKCGPGWKIVNIISHAVITDPPTDEENTNDIDTSDSKDTSMEGRGNYVDDN